MLEAGNAASGLVGRVSRIFEADGLAVECRPGPELVGPCTHLQVADGRPGRRYSLTDDIPGIGGAWLLSEYFVACQTKSQGNKE